MERRDLERRRFEGYYQGASGRTSQFGMDERDLGEFGGGHQFFGDDARWKNSERAEHYNNDMMGLGSRERRWNQNLDNFPHEGPTSHYGKGPRGYRRSDERVKEDIIEALTLAPDVDAQEIIVDVEEGVVTLTGTVRSRRMKKAAERTSESVLGVEDIINLLTMEGEGLTLWEGIDQSM